MQEHIYQLFQQSLEAKMTVGEALLAPLEQAAQQLLQALLEDKKILICGNGHSAALAQIFVTCLQDRFEHDRPGLPALWLSNPLASASSSREDAHTADNFAKPIRALGQAGDVLVMISTRGNAANLVQAASAAHERGLSLVALTGGDGGQLAALLDSQDTLVCAPIEQRSRIHEIHLLCIYCLCDLIDRSLFGIE